MKFRKNSLLKNVFLVLAVLSFVSFLCVLFLTVTAFNIGVLCLSIILFAAYNMFYWLYVLKRRGYSLKFYFSCKFEKEIKPYLKKFEDAPEYFIKDFKNQSKRIYEYSGNLFSRDSNDLLYKDKKAKEIILDLYTKLNSCINSKEGFVGFFKEIEKLNLGSNWNIHNYMINDLISPELDFLLNYVFDLTHYTIYDNGISKEFTNRNEQTIKDLKEIYSPLLYKFEDEINEIIKTLK